MLAWHFYEIFICNVIINNVIMYAMWESITIAEMFTILVEFYGDQ